MSGIHLEPVDRVEITILMDNVTDPLLVDQDAVVRMNWPKALLGGLPTAQARVSPDDGRAGRADRRAWLLGAGADREGGSRAHAVVRYRGVGEWDGGEHAPARGSIRLTWR